ncbi:MAG: hypothetical protein HZB38_19315 [Planctomycetes bacterium]|nr:hypothetical protein [Planctomycetota bacterium]
MRYFTVAVNSASIQPAATLGLGFEADAQRSIAAIRDSFAAAIEVVCGGRPRAQDVATGFQLHRKLGWQIWNVAYAADPMRAVRLMPTEHGLQVWIEASRTTGVPKDILERLEQTPAIFESLLARHAKDRGLLELLSESSDSAPDEATELRWRKMAFSGNSFTFGVRAKTLLAVAVLHPSDRWPFFDMVRVQGLLGLIRTRANVRWPFAQSIVQSGEDGHQCLPRREPLMPHGSSDGSDVPLMRDFCSQPAPAVQRRLGESGLLEDELLPGPVGQTGECTVITGEIMRELAPRHRTHEGEDAMFGTGVRTPSELLIYDHIVHKDLFPKVQRELRVYSELISPTTRDVRDRLPVSEKVQHLGRGLDRIRTAEVARYADILTCIFQRTGWKSGDFEAFRVRMRCPPIPVSVMIRHDLPAPPSAETNTA